MEKNREIQNILESSLKKIEKVQFCCILDRTRSYQSRGMTNDLLTTNLLMLTQNRYC